MARRSFKSSSSRPLSSATLKTMLSTPICVSFKPSMRPMSWGPMSEIVARTGWPCWPNTSHNWAGQATAGGTSIPRSARMRAIFSPMLPLWLMPVRSPLMSAMNTGTPASDRLSAIFCRVTVLPVPVAPVIKPWRLASDKCKAHAPWAFWAMGKSDKGAGILGFPLGGFKSKGRILGSRD